MSEVPSVVFADVLVVRPAMDNPAKMDAVAAKANPMVPKSYTTKITDKVMPIMPAKRKKSPNAVAGDSLLIVTEISNTKPI